MEVLEKAGGMIASQRDLRISYLPTVPQLVLVRSVIVEKAEICTKSVISIIESQASTDLSSLPHAPAQLPFCPLPKLS
eukprot:2979025-Heterocapsa_arctica.AAC.1